MKRINRLHSPVIFLLFFFLLLVEYSIQAQTLPFRHFSVDSGLPDTLIRCILQDSRGYLWFGSRGGLCRFDGLEIEDFSKKFPVLSDGIRALYEDRQGNLWVGTSTKGVCRWDSHEWFNFTVKHGLPHQQINSIVEDNHGNLWFGTGNGAACFNNNRFQLFDTGNGLPGKIVFDILPDRTGNIWFATVRGLACLKQGYFKTFTSAQGLINNECYSLAQDKSGNIWIGTYNGISRFNNGSFSNFKTNDETPFNAVSSIIEDREGNIWFGTTDGLSVYTNGKISATYTTQHGLLRNAVTKLIEDREGNIWIGSRTGVSCLYSRNIQNFTKLDGLKNNAVWAIMEDQEKKIWFGTEDGLSCYHQGKFTHLGKNDGLIHNSIYSLVNDRLGRIWIGTQAGLSVYSPNTQTFKNYTTADGLLNDMIPSLLQDKNGTIWIGTSAGVNYYNNGKITEPPFDISLDKINDMIQDRHGNTWFSTTNGLVRLQNGNTTHFTTSDGLPDNEIYSLAEDSRDRIWLGSNGGISIFNNQSFVNFTTNDGLPSNKCYFIVEDNQGRSWIGTSKGIACYDGKTFKNYNIVDGLVANNWHLHAFLKDSNNLLWFGSFHGVSCIDPNLHIKNRVPPEIHITGVKVMDKDSPFNQLHHLPYNQNYLKFHFIGLSYRVPEKVKYLYRLKGVNPDWTETNDRSASYAFLPPGNYHFQVKALNSDGISSLKPANITFTIRPPFWETLLFRILTVLLLLLIIGYTIYYRFKRMREKLAYDAQTRQLIMAQKMELLGILAAGAVHDLKNLLGVILGYSALAEKNINQDNSNNKNSIPIEKIKKTASTAIQVVKQILTFTRQKTDEISLCNLTTLLEDILDILKITRPPDVQILWEPPPKPIMMNINQERFQQMVMNLCINAFQAMPNGGELILTLTHRPGTPGKITMEVIDTGIGIQPDAINKIFDPLYTTKCKEKGTGLGLFVVKKIVEDYNGSIDVHSQPDKGTRFFISFTLNHVF